MDVYVFRLKAGYDIIGEFEDTESGYRLHHPMRTTYTVLDSGEAVVQLVQWLSYEIFSDFEYCILPKENVMFLAKAAPVMHDLYERSLGALLKRLEDGTYTAKVKSVKDIVQEELGGLQEEPKRKLQ